ncbi:sensor histidine kinase [Ohtaekwangia kribbensis]|jgi:two-component system NtrC family sensor kinase|uniref:histidine kinase n=1 Tax=Ohtaekwangia kribbensis TaxID=688913 RepID=A0ABW3K8P5_9BACT
MERCAKYTPDIYNFVRIMNSSDFKLKERVKELNCLYKLSKVAWEAKNDFDVIISKTLDILPAAMQHPNLAEASITMHAQDYSTPKFDSSKFIIESELSVDKKKYGKVRIGYRLPAKDGKVSFLPEEKRLLKTVARELSLVIKRASIEEEKQKLQTQLQHVERLAFVGELSAGIAHELNEPLGRVLGFAQLIKKAGSLNEQQSEDIERIIKASLYSREIIKKLMIFSRQMPQQITKVNLNDIVHNILYFIDVRFQSRGITIIKQLDPVLPVIYADEVQMSQVLVNLITNSVYAMPTGGEITVITRKKENLVSLIVKDTGTGMTSDIRNKIFEPFFTTKPVGQGTGLGLSVVQGIVDSHGGKILVSSTVNKGTKFEIQLPQRQNKKKS